MTKLLVILGATGGAVVSTYLSKPGWKIRAVTRDPSKPSAGRLRAQGAEVVAADLNNADSLVAAFKGAHMIFAVTDFWAPFSDPDSQAKLSLGQTINEFCYDIEVSQGKNIASAAFANIATLDHLIWSSLVDSRKWSKGKYKWNLHFDSKAHIFNHIQEAYPALAARTSQLFMGAYMDNFKRSSIFGPQRQDDGTFALEWPQPPDTLEPFVDTPSDTGKFVEALEELGPGKKLFGVSDMRSGGEFIRVWAEILGVKGVYKRISYVELGSRIPHKDFAREILDSRGFNEEFGWVGGEEDMLLPKELGIKTTTLEDYIRREDWSRVFRKESEKL